MIMLPFARRCAVAAALLALPLAANAADTPAQQKTGSAAHPEVVAPAARPAHADTGGQAAPSTDKAAPEAAAPAAAPAAGTAAGTAPASEPAAPAAGGTPSATPVAAPAAPPAEPGLSDPARPECAWAGERILGLMWRDDIRTASDFLALYDRFQCPAERVPVAFRCLIRIGVSTDQGDPGLPLRSRACWTDPNLDASIFKAPAPGADKAGNGDKAAPAPGAESSPKAEPAQQGEQKKS